jgi:lipoprotein NlpI
MTAWACRALGGAAVIMAAMMFVSPVVAESTPEWKCNASGDITPDERIAACTSVLESGKYGQQGAIKAHLSRAAAYSKKGDFERAIADYTQFLELFPKNMFAYYCRGVAYYRKQDYDRAIADYTTAIQLNPRHQHAYVNRGAAYYQSGDLDRAVADYDLAIQLNPEDGRAYIARGVAFYGKGDIDRALSEYEQAIRLNPQDENALLHRAAAYRAKGELEHAIADYDQLIELKPKNARAYRDRAMTYLQAGSTLKSLADLDQSSELDPKDVYTALWRDIVVKRSNLPGRLAEATRDLDMNKWPAPIVRLFLGELPPEAVFAAAADPIGWKKRGQVCEANFYVGALALQRGEREGAQRLFQLAVAECPKGFVEWQAANAELKAIGTTP